MKKVFTLIISLLVVLLLHAQTCTITGFDMCATGVTSDFRNAIQISGTGSPLTAGSKYKFANAIPAMNLDAVISIDAIVNATMTGIANPTIDDDAATDETGVAASQAGLFSPRIAPDQILSCNDRLGYVEFSVKFYTHYNGNSMPSPGTEIAVANLSIINFDMDGFTVGTNGWFKETGYVKTNLGEPTTIDASPTELSNGGNSNGWILTYGSITERQGIARCAEVIEKSLYTNPLTAISFRLGYAYKAPISNCNSTGIQPIRDYGLRFGCFNLLTGGTLPVSFTNFIATAVTEKVNISWTSLQEHNLESYEIQRSFDGTNFEVAGDVKANNLTSIQDYHFTDNIAAFNSRYIYYRIRISDFDHSMKLTNTVIVKIAAPKANEMLISPNPSSSTVQLKISSKTTAAGVITIFDASGKAVLKQQVSLLTGNNTIAVNDITTLKEGYYTVQLLTNNETFNSKLLIWR